MARNGGRFDFDDGGTYCGSWEEGRANGHGVCTGPDGKGEYAGAWHYGFEVSGIYTWPSGSTYAGQWQNGRRHGLGVESRGRWIYRGEWTQGQRGRYGKREVISTTTNMVTAHYLGTWTAGFNDGYGTETYPDGGTYVGQWQRSMRHGYGIRRSAPYGAALKQRPKSERNASLSSLRSVYDDEQPKQNSTKPEVECVDGRAGFVLRARSDAPARRRRSLSERSLAVKRSILSNLRIKKQHSTGDIHQRVTSMTGSIRSSGSLLSCASDDSEHQHHGTIRGDMVETPEERIEPGVTEYYRGEWKNDQRSGFGICERSDGLKYVGEWNENRKNGYGITYFKDGTKEEGRYKNNVLVSSTRRKALLFVRTSRMRDKIEASVEAANRAASIASQKADIAASRTQTAQERAEAADSTAMRAKGDADVARITATQFDPNFVQPGIQALRKNRETNRVMLNNIGGAHANHVSFDSTLSSTSVPPSTSALGSRMTHSYQQLPMGNHRPAPVPTTNYPTSNRIADSQHQLDQYSKSFDYSNAIPASTSHNPGAGHIADNYEQTLAHQQLAAQLAPDRPRLHNSGSSTNPTAGELVNDGASTSATLRLNPEGWVSSAEQQSVQSEANPSMKSVNLNELSPRITPLKRGRQGGGSILSLSDDHFDQYTLSRNLSEAEGTKLRRNRPSLTRQSEVNADLGGINRRSTMASASDRKNAPITRNIISKDLETREDRGSLPNIAELEGTGIKLNREDAARLASQRRQEAQRILEEEELLRANPLRYLFHPTLRNWIIQRKVQILLILANCFLLFVFYYLLTMERSYNKHGKNPSKKEL